jgi:outer membrane lipoprotein-sorting protein
MIFAHLNNNIAFAEVLNYIQAQGYSFDLTVQADNASETMRGMILQPGRMRFDATTGVGRFSIVTDTNSHKTLLLSRHFKTAQYVNTADEYERIGASKLLHLCSRPIQNLWNLRDGTEEELGKRVFDGYTTLGFKVIHSDDNFDNEITLWADARSGRPVSVEIISTTIQQPGSQLVWTLNNFDLDAELDESIFSLEVPAGYALAHQKSLQDIDFADESDQEAQKIVDAMQLWKDNKKNEAIKILLDVNWDKSITFSKEPYIFTMTERELTSLTKAEQEKLMPIIMDSCSMLRKICFELVRVAKEAIAINDYDKAELHLKTALYFGELVNHDPEAMFIVRLVGIAIRKLSLVQLESLYEQSNQPDKLNSVRQKIQQVDAYHKSLADKGVVGYRK